MAEDGYRLWLRYDKIDNPALLQQYRDVISGIYIEGSSATYNIIKGELSTGLSGLLAKRTPFVSTITDKCIVAGTAKGSPFISSFSNVELSKLGTEGFIIRSKKINNKNVIILTANTDIGVLYG